jgi:hypothetical protein
MKALIVSVVTHQQLQFQQVLVLQSPGSVDHFSECFQKVQGNFFLNIQDHQ